ncbi:MAG TPA: ABC transporter permease [Solirubrobacteraceae bacterium]|nr:ABC transporter permease [Solirubrobacteraceae bacterium]
MAATPTTAPGAGAPQTPAGDGLAAGPRHQIVGVRVPARSVRGELRAVKVVWKRELIRFSHDRLRIVASLTQPFLYLFVLGTGLSRLAAGGTHGVNLRTFVYPGVLCMAVMLIAMFSAASLVWDREFGFLREMMVAPVRRSSLVIGKCLGGATVAGFEGVIVLCLAGLVGVPYAPTLVLEVFALQLLVAFSITAFGVMVAARITQVQSFMALTQMVILPMYFLSGALYPVTHLPRWLEILNRLDPITYAVDAIRKAVFAHLHVSAAARHALDQGVTWWGWHLPGLVEAGVVALLGLIMLSIAIAEFTYAE